jgi:hypothetical protein
MDQIPRFTKWYYAGIRMVPKLCVCNAAQKKKLLTQKCEGYKASSTQFRQHGRKAYIRGYMHGFCHKTNMFTDDGRPDFLPFVEIMDIDWVSASTATRMFQQLPRSFRSQMLPTAKVNGRLPLIPLQTRGLHQALILKIKRNLTVRTKLDVSDHAYLVLACANYYIQV